MEITKDQLMGVVRHVLTAVGAYLVSKGLVDDSLVQEGVGALLTLASIVWSVWSKK